MHKKQPAMDAKAPFACATLQTGRNFDGRRLEIFGILISLVTCDGS